MRASSSELAIRLLVYVGGVLSAVLGSLVSSKIRIYHDNRKSHLEDIKQKVLMPLADGFDEKHHSLVKHRTPVITAEWGLRARKENASATEQPDEHGPMLIIAAPDIRGTTDPILYVDAKKKHFPKLIAHTDDFLLAWRAHAQKCCDWVCRIAEEVLCDSEMPAHPISTGPRYVMHHRLATFVYMRLFNISGAAVSKRNQNFGSQSPSWVLESGTGAVALGTEEDMGRLMCLLDRLLEKERPTAALLRDEARVLEKELSTLRGELNYAIAARRLRRRCDLVPFF